MADDTPERPKSTPRRRRQPRATTPAVRSEHVPDAVDLPGVPQGIGPGEDTPEPIDAGSPSIPIPDEPVDPNPLLGGRSPNEWVCPFFRSVDAGGRLGAPIERPDIANRCAAQAEAVPQSLRQQELVCLTSAHVDCPRYLRGAVAPVEPAARVRGTPALTPAMLGAIGLLVAAFAASVVFAVARGGLDLPAAVASPSPVAPPSDVAGGPSPDTSPTVTPAPSPAIDSSPSPSISGGPSPDPSAGSSPTAGTTPTAAPSANPTSDRYALLVPCPNKPDCWIYRIRAGDNLSSIANYFGVPLATVRTLNPWTTTSGLRVGRDLILPPPTR